MPSPLVNDILLRENFLPYQVSGLQAWYSMKSATDYITATGIKLLGDKSGNSNTNAWVSGGAASNTATAPTASITGNQTLTADIQFPDYTPGTNHVLFSKVNGNSGITWTLLTTGVSRLTIGDGAALTNFDSTVAIPATDLLRGTLQVVYTDNTSMVTTWNGVAVGTTVTVNKVLANGAATATIGTTCAGVIYSLTVGSVYNFQPSAAGKLATSFVAPVTGETWTINTSGDVGARICGARDLVQMTGANQPTISAGGALFDGTNDYLKAAAFSLSQPTTVYFVGQQVTWTDIDKFYDGGSSDAFMLNQTTSGGGASPRIGFYAGGAQLTTDSMALGANAVITTVGNGTSGAIRYNRTAPVTGNAGAQAANGFTLGARADASRCGNILVYEVLLFSGVQTQSAQDRIVNWLGRRWNIGV